MINKFWKNLFKKEPARATRSEPVVLRRNDHSVSRKLISANALKVLNRLHRANYQAYLVGGGVRDILLGLHPKDFDIATNATPEEIKKLFRNCRIIGRRFRLAHILFGRETIEVATFRANHDQSSPHGQTHASGMLVRDNVYGSLEEDAERRDFTVNALYYSSDDYTVRDFTGGLADLNQRHLRLIGDPLTRYQEDPVRMLRAVRLAVKLGLTIEENTAKPIAPNAQLLRNVSAARLWDESHKLFLAGHAQDTYRELRNYGLFRYMLPATQQSLELDDKDTFNQFILAALESTDQRAKQEKPITPAFLYAVFLWQPLLHRAEQLVEQGMSKNDALHKAMSQVLTEQSQFISIPKRFSLVIRDMWALQSRLEYRTHRSYKLLEHPKFRAAYDFLVLRSQADEKLNSIANWWTRYQEASPEGQRSMIQSLSGKKKFKSKRKKRRFPKKNSKENS
ncbi:polynucleotide adenylyltransferase PcnB [Pleionea sediminis]|uniref:polynucleotide adenylyltransferase PcnB n=1 Tax=Pleionea sediminis TaxID=2569479 RepID=UPI001184A37B|nr:polynucleotide adenylyltransferase PcnB [Pleionea sediminis]